MPRYIDADAPKKDLTRFYDNEVTARELIDEQPTADVQPVKQDTELSSILQDYGIKDTDALRYILDQYQKIIVYITGGQMSDMTYPAQVVIECVNDYYLSALAEKFCPRCGAKLIKDGDSE